MTYYDYKFKTFSLQSYQSLICILILLQCYTFLLISIFISFFIILYMCITWIHFFLIRQSTDYLCILIKEFSLFILIVITEVAKPFKIICSFFTFFFSFFFHYGFFFFKQTNLSFTIVLPLFHCFLTFLNFLLLKTGQIISSFLHLT